MAYEMHGQFLEACDCAVACPCWFVEDPDEATCTGVVAWQIEQGTIEGIDVSGLSAVSVSQHDGRRGAAGDHAKMRMALYVDEHATEAQQQAVSQAFTGRLGGPLAELAEMIDADPQIQPAAIRFASDGGRTALRVGQVISTEMTPLVGATQRVTTIADSAMATLLGTPGEVGRAAHLAMDLPQHGLLIEVRGRSATRGRFAYAVR